VIDSCRKARAICQGVDRTSEQIVWTELEICQDRGRVEVEKTGGDSTVAGKDRW